MQRIREALRRRDAAGADSLVRRLTVAIPHSAEVWEMDSAVGAAVGDAGRAATSAQRAIEHGGDNTQNWVRLARARWQRREIGAFEECVMRARAAVRSGACLVQLGDLFIVLEDFAKALEAYDEAVRREPDNLRYLGNRAALRRFMGHLEEAESDYDRVIESDPGECEAWLSRAELRKQDAQRNHIEALTSRLATGFTSWTGEIPIRYALAKEYEDLGEYTNSWQHLTAGAALRRRHLQYDLKTDLDTVEWICEAFSQAGSRERGCSSTAPIFIVGMPRTGTTLLERVLAGHPQVFAAGELTHLSLALVAAAQRKVGRSRLSRRELVTVSADLDYRALGEDYLARTRLRTGEVPRFVDKMPLNYLYCGIIHRALPNARILHMTRHPLATCYAVFKTLFNQAYPFSYDLAELTAYYLSYRKLMTHWKRVFPGVILDVSYERLVCASESESQLVFDFCGLSWDRSYLHVEKVAAPSTTASAPQVRRPIYRDSLELWRHYEQELDPIAQRLATAGVDLA